MLFAYEIQPIYFTHFSTFGTHYLVPVPAAVASDEILMVAHDSFLVNLNVIKHFFFKWSPHIHLLSMISIIIPFDKDHLNKKIIVNKSWQWQRFINNYTFAIYDQNKRLI